jgi:predicted ATP-grasp superfamily ATP-dependent carboligase
VSDERPDSQPDQVAPDEVASDEVAPDEPVPGDDVMDVEAAQVPDEPVMTVTAEPVPVEPADTGYTAGGVPTFDSVREKIETRYGTAIGAAELASETPEGRTVEQQYDARQRAAVKRMEQIRASMRDDETDADTGQA